VCGARKLWKVSDIAHGRGNYCGWAHYAAARREQGARVFWRHVQRGEPDACWPWVGAVSYQGYGRTRWQGRHVNASRAAWLHTHGAIWPADLVVCHHCDNPSCCNPTHLFLDTNGGNQADKARKGRAIGARPDGANRLKVGTRWQALAARDGARVRIKGFRTDVAQQLLVVYTLPSGNVTSCCLEEFLDAFTEAA
jgi:hypothetical protein